jgi:hypothetical protein
MFFSWKHPQAILREICYLTYKDSESFDVDIGSAEHRKTLAPFVHRDIIGGDVLLVKTKKSLRVLAVCPAQMQSIFGPERGLLPSEPGDSRPAAGIATMSVGHFRDVVFALVRTALRRVPIAVALEESARRRPSAVSGKLPPRGKLVGRFRVFGDFSRGLSGGSRLRLAETGITLAAAWPVAPSGADSIDCPGC